MSTNEPGHHETGGKEVEQPCEHVESVPVTVPAELEEEARERLQAKKQNPNDRTNFEARSDRDVLCELLMDRTDLRFEFLTRDVEHKQFGEPVTHALHTAVTEQQYEQVFEATRESVTADSIQEWVRDAVRMRLTMMNDDELVLKLREEGGE